MARWSLWGLEYIMWGGYPKEGGLHLCNYGEVIIHTG